MGDICARGSEVRLYLLGDDLADMLRDGLHNFIGNVWVARRLKPPWLVSA
jgi:hypothetical protein